MKITQKPEFQPITIVIETAAEAEALWAALENRVQPDQIKIVNDLANWFATKAQLLG